MGGGGWLVEFDWGITKKGFKVGGGAGGINGSSGSGSGKLAVANWQWQWLIFIINESPQSNYLV